MINILTFTCPNGPGIGAIDNPDRFEQVFDTYYIPEVSEKIFMDDISMVRPQKTYVFGGYPGVGNSCGGDIVAPPSDFW